MNKAAKAATGIGAAAAAAAAIGCAVFFLLYPPVKADGAVSPDRIVDSSSIRIASYNTAAPWGNPLLGTGSSRRAVLFSNELCRISPDSIGVQEINSEWVGKLSEINPGYAYYGIQRGGDKNERQSEMSGIFYLKEKYDLLESDTFWISETPEQMSKYPGAGCNRICSYVVLKNRTTGFTYAHLNTHLDNVSTEAQDLGGKLIAEKAQQLQERYGNTLGIVITGDLNQYEDGAACSALAQAGYLNASAVNPEAAQSPTYHNWGRISEGQPIDFIYYAGGLNAKSYTVHTNRADRACTSDHYCISADLTLNHESGNPS